MVLWKTNLKLALSTLGRAKWRSFMTVSGVAIGVLSVVTIVGIGEGAKNDVREQINYFENDIVTVRPGSFINRNDDGDITGFNFFVPPNEALTEKDVSAVSKLESSGEVSGFNVVNSLVEHDDTTYTEALITGVDASTETIIDQPIQYGEFFDADDGNAAAAVIGRAIALDVFGDRAPIGKSMTIRGTDVVVRGVFEPFPTSPFSPNPDYNRSIMLPYEFSKELSDGDVQIMQILALPTEQVSSDKLAADIDEALQANRAGVDNYSVLQKSDNVAVANDILNILTGFVSAIAAVSLLVAGIGIMNIMLVSVSERSEEIGLRKAIGATNQQIMGQFMAESLVLSVAGGLLGIAGSYAANYFIRLLSDLRPIVSFEIVLIAAVVSVAIGVVFGVMPALSAARKDPVRALKRI